MNVSAQHHSNASAFTSPGSCVLEKWCYYCSRTRFLKIFIPPLCCFSVKSGPKVRLVTMWKHCWEVTNSSLSSSLFLVKISPGCLCLFLQFHGPPNQSELLSYLQLLAQSPVLISWKWTYKMNMAFVICFTSAVCCPLLALITLLAIVIKYLLVSLTSLCIVVLFYLWLP